MVNSELCHGDRSAVRKKHYQRFRGTLLSRFIGFSTASAYVKLLDTQNKYVELLPVTAVFDHPKKTEGVKGYYSDVIIHVDGR